MAHDDGTARKRGRQRCHRLCEYQKFAALVHESAESDHTNRRCRIECETAREWRCAEWSFIQKLRCLRVAVENQAVLSEIVSALVGEVECDGDG